MAYNRTWEDPERLERERPIGSKAVVDGVEKLWAGPDLGYQSEATFNELQTEGYGGDQDYMLSGGWQARRAQLGINKVIEAVTPVVAPAVPYLQQAYEFGTTSLQREALQIGGKGLMWGLNKIDQGVSAGSRALGIHPFWGNAAIETAAELATPTVSTTALKYGGKAWKAADIAELGYIPSRIHEATRTSARALDTVGSVGAAGSPKAKRLTLTRTDEVLAWIDEGNEFVKQTGSQRNWKNKIFTDKDGNQWELKSQGTGKPYAPRSLEAAARDKAGRNLRENAWRAQLKEALERRGTYTPERYKELEKRIESGINKMKAHIRKYNKGKAKPDKISLGHKKSLEEGGLNVPENIVFEPYLENVSTQHKLDPPDAAVRQSGGPLSIEEWVAQQEIMEEFGDILPYAGLPNDLQIKILKTKSQAARDALVEAYYLKNTKIE